MDDAEVSHSNLSLVPYLSDNREVVLRHGSSIVLYDERSQQLSIRDTQNLSSRGVEETNKCPWCSRPFHVDDATSEGDAGAAAKEASFANPKYFGLLRQSREGSHHSSRDTSPKRLPLPGGSSTASQFVSANDQDVGKDRPDRHISPQAFSPGYYEAFFREEGELGRGGKGVVYLVRHVLENVELGYFACKRVPVGDNREWLQRVLVEVQLLQTLSHSNLVSYKHVWLEDIQITTFGPSVPCAFILQQFCDAGDLQRYVLQMFPSSPTKEDLKERVRRGSKAGSDLEPPLKENTKRRPMLFDEIFSFFKDITSGLHHLHTKLLIHRDLKPSNCLLQRDGPKIRVLLSDFGEMQGVNVMRHGTGATGTISWSAPEVVRQEQLGQIYGNFTTKSDVFSLGLILHFMCFAKLPYKHADSLHEEQEDVSQLREEIGEWQGMDEMRRDRTDLPERLYKVLGALLAVDPEKRPGTEEILQTLRAGTAFSDGSTWRTAQAPGEAVNHHAPELERRPSRFGGRKMDRKNSTGGGHPSPPLASDFDPPPSRREPVRQASRSSLILRKPPPGIESSEDDRPEEKLHDAAVRSPRLLGPPTPVQNPLFPNAISLRRRQLLAGIQIALFCVKTYLCMIPCSPIGVNTSFVMPLLAIASFDMVGFVRGPLISALLLILHIAAVFLARRFDLLCDSGLQRWEGPMAHVPP